MALVEAAVGTGSDLPPTEVASDLGLLRAAIDDARRAGWSAGERLVHDVDRFLRATRPGQTTVWRHQRFLASEASVLPRRADNPWRA